MKKTLEISSNGESSRPQSHSNETTLLKSQNADVEVEIFDDEIKTGNLQIQNQGFVRKDVANIAYLGKEKEVDDEAKGKLSLTFFKLSKVSFINILF